MKNKEKIKELKKEIKSLKIELAKERGFIYFDKKALEDVRLKYYRHALEIGMKPVYFDPFKAMLPSNLSHFNYVIHY